VRVCREADALTDGGQERETDAEGDALDRDVPDGATANVRQEADDDAEEE